MNRSHLVHLIDIYRVVYSRHYFKLLGKIDILIKNEMLGEKEAFSFPWTIRCMKII